MTRHVPGVADTAALPFRHLCPEHVGRWLLHCHNLFHMAAGMMTEVTYEGSA